MKIIRTVTFGAVLFIAGAVPAFAQNTTSLVLGGGVSNFDLSGTGNAPVFAARVTRELGSNLVIEGGVTFAKPDQDFGPSTLILPEAQLQYHFPVGRFTPYLGAGIGASRHSADGLETDWNPTISFAGGTRIAVNDRVGVFGELRIRGVEWDFAGSMADITGGVAIRLGR